MAVRWGPWRCEGCGKRFMSNGLCQHLRCRECHPECGRMAKVCEVGLIKMKGLGD